MIYIKEGIQSWGCVAYTFDGSYVYDRYGNVAYTLRGDQLYMGIGTNGAIKYTIDGNNICEGPTRFNVKYSIQGNHIVEGTASWGSVLYNLSDRP